MKKILLYKNTERVRVWDVSTPELMEVAKRALFKYLDEILNVYSFSGYDERTTVKAARNGHIRAIEEILHYHRYLDYEEWSIVEVEQ
jgi:hypothetical protein